MQAVALAEALKICTARTYEFICGDNKQKTNFKTTIICFYGFVNKSVQVIFLTYTLYFTSSELVAFMRMISYCFYNPSVTS